MIIPEKTPDWVHLPGSNGTQINAEKAGFTLITKILILVWPDPRRSANAQHPVLSAYHCL
jgi:hypothetical protein